MPSKCLTQTIPNEKKWLLTDLNFIEFIDLNANDTIAILIASPNISDTMWNGGRLGAGILLWIYFISLNYILFKF